MKIIFAAGFLILGTALFADSAVLYTENPDGTVTKSEVQVLSDQDYKQQMLDLRGKIEHIRAMRDEQNAQWDAEIARYSAELNALMSARSGK